MKKFSSNAVSAESSFRAMVQKISRNTGKSEVRLRTNIGINGTLSDNGINTDLIAPKTPTRTIFVFCSTFAFVLMVRPS